MFLKFTKKDVLTIPNLLSVLRLALIPVYAVLYLNAESLTDYLIAAAVFAFSVLTDMVDGIIARTCHMTSKLGIILDPLADKMTQGVILICLALRHKAVIPLLLLFIVKEGFMLIMACLNLKKGKMLDGALFAGKICTTVLFVSMVILIVFPNLPALWVNLLVGLCTVFLLISLVSYALCYFKRSPRIKNIEP